MKNLITQFALKLSFLLLSQHTQASSCKLASLTLEIFPQKAVNKINASKTLFIRHDLKSSGPKNWGNSYSESKIFGVGIKRRTPFCSFFA